MDGDAFPVSMWDSSGRRADKSSVGLAFRAASIRTNGKINISARASVFLAWRYPEVDLSHVE